MDNAELERKITESLAQTRSDIRADLSRLEGIIDYHRTDAYAHRQMVDSYSGERRDWSSWRTKVDTRFAYLTGGLAVLTFATSVFGAFVAQHIFH